MGWCVCDAAVFASVTVGPTRVMKDVNDSCRVLDCRDVTGGSSRGVVGLDIRVIAFLQS